MRARWGTALVVLASGALAACGSGNQSEDAAVSASQAPAGAETVAVAGPPAAFGQCVSCHAVKPGLNGVGPSVFGIVDRKAASVPGYAYSNQLKAANLTWDEATLDKWLAGPMQMVPGTKMVFPGMPDAARRKEVIDYLKTLK